MTVAPRNCMTSTSISHELGKPVKLRGRTPVEAAAGQLKGFGARGNAVRGRRERPGPGPDGARQLSGRATQGLPP
jgi:hypothetical protein